MLHIFNNSVLLIKTNKYISIISFFFNYTKKIILMLGIGTHINTII